MKILSTPQARFSNLPDYPFEPNYLEVDKSLRMHYVDKGKSTERTWLLLHGEPSWSYLYRHMIPPLVDAGYRVIAPDLIGFGRSDKPVEEGDYTYANHLHWLTNFLTSLDLKQIFLFCQDWGGLLGLRLAAAMPDRFDAIVASNTFLPTGDHPMPPAFKQWQQFSKTVPRFPVGRVINGGTVTDLSDEIIAAYDAPFPDESYKAGARAFPAIVPTEADDPESIANRAAWKKFATWHKPFLTLFGDSDPITGGAEKIFQKQVPGAQGQPHAIIAGAGHFIQEDKGAELAALLVDFAKSIK